jgi:sugar lactone lactonase YvrE
MAVLTALVLSSGLATAAPAGDTFPEIISLPDGFRPEGVVVGRGHTLYAGSIPTGAIYQVNLRTGEGSILVPPQTGRAAIGLDFDARTNYIFVAGGPTGYGYVYDADTGATVGVYQLTTATPTFVNDVIVTRDAAYFTDSSQPVFYRLPLSAGGGLPDPGAVETIPLSGDYVFVPGQFNANGIEATSNGRWLIIVNSTVGALYRVDPLTGDATEIDLGGANVMRGDGLLLVGRTLYVVQNTLNQIAVVRLDPSFTSGEVVQVLTHAMFDVPTTVARFGAALYAVNARFTTPPTPTTEYWIVKLSR